MSLSDCIKCWDTPCTCGYGYRGWPKAARVKQAEIILGLRPGTLAEMEILDDIPEDHPRKEEK